MDQRDAEVNEEFWDRGPSLADTSRCRECEALITQEEDLCEVCQSGWITWLENRHKEMS